MSKTPIHTIIKQSLSRWMKAGLLLLFVHLLCSTSLSAQDFQKDSHTTDEKRDGLIARYIQQYDSFAGTVVELYRDHTFQFNSATCMTSVYSRGKWKERRGNIILTGYYRKGIPIKIKYLQERDSVQDQVIRVVENQQGVSCTMALVQVNTDSSAYFPLMGNDNPPTGPIKRVRVSLDNGTVSKWMKVSSRPYQSLRIVMLTSLDMERFVIIDRVKFNKTTGKVLVQPSN